MRIGIDASRLRGGMSGIGHYIYNILAPLDAELPEATFILYTRSGFELGLPSERWALRQDTHPVWSRMPTVFWTRFRMGALARQDGLDAFWAANTLLPIGISAVPCVATVYDLNHLLAPQTMAPLTRFAYRAWFAHAIHAANYRVAISQGTSSRLQSKFGRQADAVALPAIPFRGALLAREEAERILERLGVSRPYILTVGTQEPRKNLSSVVHAMAIQKALGHLEGHQLVMAGAAGWGGNSRKDTELMRSAWIKPMGYVDDSALVALYMLADAFVFPSIYEGYGIPVSEALAYGCPVVATDMPELREAGGPGVVYVEPTPNGIAQGLDAVLAAQRRGPRPPAHDWSTAAKVMAEAFRGIAS